VLTQVYVQHPPDRSGNDGRRGAEGHLGDW